ncbi:MAG TPA: hypothetical protein VM513_29535 [Kofleriaceae bacterium]|jgi:hypothetical protein|nr:hypothetical protein [Kofleriaceae bacterium]
MILAIDPGNEYSAYVALNGERVVARAKVSNETMLAAVQRANEHGGQLGVLGIEMLVIEMIASYGMPVGREVFETCVWIGRFIEAWGGDHALIYRRDIKLHLCGSARAKDGNIRQALIDRWGGKEKAIGKKASPGPLYGVSADVWAALAVAVTYADQNAHARTRGGLDGAVSDSATSSEPLTERSHFVRESDAPSLRTGLNPGVGGGR